jgi:phosphatidylinositol-3-phosphatase
MRWIRFLTPNMICVCTALSLTSCGGGSTGVASNGTTPPSSPAISVSVSPSSADVQVGSTQQFTVTISNTSNTAVSWSVDRVVGGNTSTGTISSSGLYAAPIAVPNPASVTVTAVSQADSTKSGSAAATIMLPQIGHVFLLVEENHSYSSVIGNPAMPYLNSLASAYGLATNYYADTHPSIGNYFMLTTGQIITNDDSYKATVTADNLVRELIAVGKTWKSYAESLPSVGYTGGDVYPYLEHHNPFSYFSDVRSSSTQALNLVPFTQFAADLANDQLPDFGYIVPNAADDAHDCPDGTQNCSDSVKISRADSWLQTNISPLIASKAFQQDGLLIIVFDESFDTDTQHGGGEVPLVLISRKAKASYQSTALYQHESTLRTLVETTGAAAFPGVSASAADMGEFFP